MPKLSKAELSVSDAVAVRKREAREAKAVREQVQRAAVDAATHEWWRQQAELAAELGIKFDDWQRITSLLSKPPPMRVGNQIVMNTSRSRRAS